MHRPRARMHSRTSAPDFDEIQRGTYDDKYFDTVDSYYGGHRDCKPTYGNRPSYPYVSAR